jgi:MFS family permease
MNRELSEIYMTIAIKFFALSLITIFIPIYLFQLGFDLKYIFLFFAILSAASSLTVYLSIKLSTKLGIKHGILISIPFLIAYFILLEFVTTNSLNWIFFLTPITAGIHGSLFWTNFHIDFAAFSSKKFRARQVGGYMIISLILAAIGPILGAFIISNWDFNVLFVLVSILLFLSTLPLFMSEEHYVHRDFSIKKVRNVIKKAGPTAMSGFIGQAMISCALCAWPLFIFLILRGYLDVGALTSLTFFIAIGSTFFIAKFADKFGKAKILRIGSIFSSIGWIIRASVSTFIQIVGANIFFGIIGPSYTGTTFDAKNYDMARKGHIPEVIALREMGINTSTALLFFLLFFIGSLELALILGTIGSIFVFIFSFQKKKI